MGIAGAQLPVMPDFAGPQRGFHHTADSALEVLWSLGVAASRITVRMVGAGWRTGWVVDQAPPPGVPLGSDVSVSLSVAGLGLFHLLPLGFWDEGGPAEPGTKEIVSLVDDPMQKLAHWIREGAQLFDIQRDNYAACARWIELFGLDPDRWPREHWYGLALVLPVLHRLAGQEDGIRFALRLVFDLPFEGIRPKPGFRFLLDKDLTMLGGRASRLGSDFVLGDRLEDEAHLILVIGPVPLGTYYRFQQDAEQRHLRDLLGLCVPLHQTYRVGWDVLDRRQPPRLGCGEQNARLGVNSYLGENPGA
jgi:Type VI secretion, TssG